MSRAKPWSFSEKQALMENYEKCTIKELCALFPKRSSEAINNKIKRLKREGKITSSKDEDAVRRAYAQRSSE